MSAPVAESVEPSAAPLIYGDEPGLKRRVRGGIIWTAASGWGNQLVNFSVFLILARLLEPASFGLIALAGVYMHVSAIFVDQGLATAITQREKLERAHLDSAFWMSVAAGVLLTALGIALSSTVASIFGEPELKRIVALLSLNFLFTSLNGVQRGLLSRAFAFRSLAIRSLGATAVGGAVGVAMAAKGMGVMSLVGMELAAGVTGVLLLWSLADWRPRLSFSIDHARALVAFGGSIIGIRLLNVVSKRSDDVLIGFFLGSVALGYYVVAYKVFKILLDVFSRVFTKVAVPAFASIQSDKRRVREAFYRAAAMLALVGFPPFVFVSSMAPVIVPLLFGEQWSPSATVMQVLALLGLVQCLYLLTHQLQIACGKPQWTLRTLAASTGLSVIGFLFAVKHGIVAVALAYAAVGYLMLPIQLRLLRSLIDLRLAELAFWLRGPAVGAAVLAATCLLLRFLVADEISAEALLLVAGTVGAAIYGFTVWTIHPELLTEARTLFLRRRRVRTYAVAGSELANRRGD